LIDPHKVHLTGENSFLRLKARDDGPETTTCAHWRALFSPAGPGHALFVRSDATGNTTRIYSDNVALVRWLQPIEDVVNRKLFADPALPVVAARFSRSGDLSAGYNEIVESTDGKITLNWRDFGEPYFIKFEVGTTGPWGVFSCLIPARSATLTVAGKTAAGATYPEPLAGHPSSMSCVAWGETWLR